MTSLIPTVTVVDGQPRVSSLDIAEKFGKPHKDILNVIRRTIADLPQEFTERNFSPSEYSDSTGRRLPMYHLTRDGFSLVVMGFTGKEALAWKVRYIEAFNAMERTILEGVTNQALPGYQARQKALPFAEAESNAAIEIAVQEMRMAARLLLEKESALIQLISSRMRRSGCFAMGDPRRSVCLQAHETMEATSSSLLNMIEAMESNARMAAGIVAALAR